MNEALSPILPDAVAQLIGMSDVEPSDDASALDWALYWANLGVHLCPSERWMSRPLVSERWYRDATTSSTSIVEWFTQWPDADIRAAPDKSGRFVIVAVGAEGGHDSLEELEEEHGVLPTAFRYWTRETGHPWSSNQHLWIKGSARTSHHKLGTGLHVLGPGMYVNLPNSYAPDPVGLWMNK